MNTYTRPCIPPYSNYHVQMCRCFTHDLFCKRIFLGFQFKPSQLATLTTPWQRRPSAAEQGPALSRAPGSDQSGGLSFHHKLVLSISPSFRTFGRFFPHQNLKNLSLQLNDTTSIVTFHCYYAHVLPHNNPQHLP